MSRTSRHHGQGHVVSLGEDHVDRGDRLVDGERDVLRQRLGLIDRYDVLAHDQRVVAFLAAELCEELVVLDPPCSRGS